MLLAFYSLTSQTMQGNWMIGGSAYFSSYSYDHQEGSKNVLFVSPNAGYFIRNNFAAGALLEYSHYSNYDYEVFDFDPYLRYYFLSIGDKAKFLGQAKGGFRLSSVSFPGQTNKSFDIGIGAGISLFLNQNIALEGVVNFKSFLTSTFPANYIINFNIGFQYFLWSDKG